MTASPTLRKLTLPKAVLLDWDSTLIDNWGAIAAALAVCFEAMGLEPWTEEQTRANAKHSMRDTFPKLFGDRTEEAVRVFQESFAARHLETVQPLPGSKDLLDHLRSQSVPMALVSNKTGSFLRAEAEHLGWSSYFHRMVGAGDADRDKPAPDAVHMALDGTEIVPHKAVWFVGDSAVDLACAKAAGCLPVLVHPQDPHPEDLSAHPPAVHVAGCHELLSLIGD